MIGAIGILCVAAIVWFAIGFLARQETDRRSLLDAVDKATSELRATVVALQDARAKAESASRAKSEFLANMSHELRTPLNAILGFSEVIRDELLGPVGKPKYLEYARDINDAGSHLLRLINEVLDLAKIEAGRMTIDAAPCDMAEVVRAATALVRPLAERKRLILNEPAADRVMPGYADDRIATQVIVNLLSNAVKFTPEGGVVSLELRRRDALGVRIVVADTGIGMTPAQIGIAFEKFGQVENAFSRTQEGTGLGLPLTRALVELHGGSVAIESVVGRGTTVTIDFPGPPAAPTDQNAPTS
jgi:signal transduction histidine kinase